MGYEQDEPLPSPPAGSPARRTRWIATPSSGPGGRGHGIFTMILPYMERIDLQLRSTSRSPRSGTQGAVNAGAINYTGLATRI